MTTRDSQKMMQDVLQYWLENDKDKSWMKLAEAIKECGYGVLADNIRSKCCISQPTHSSLLEKKKLVKMFVPFSYLTNSNCEETMLFVTYDSFFRCLKVMSNTIIYYLQCNLSTKGRQRAT